MHERLLWMIAGICIFVGLPLMFVSQQFLDDQFVQYITLTGRVVDVQETFIRIIPETPLLVWNPPSSVQQNQTITIQGVLAEYKGKLQLQAKT